MSVGRIAVGAAKSTAKGLVRATAGGGAAGAKANLAIDMAKMQRDLQRIAEKKKDIARTAVFGAGNVFESESHELAPRDTGKLEQSIHKDQKVGRRGPEVHVGADVPYAKYQEFGTSKNRAHPFIRPALQRAVQHLRITVRR